MPAPASRAQRRRALRLSGTLAGTAAAVVLAGALPGTAFAAPAPAATPATSASTASVAAAATLPAAPQEFSMTYTGGVIRVQFLDPGSTAPTITGYEISLDSGGTWTALATTPFTYSNGLQARVLRGSVPVADGYIYRVSVRAVTATGKGAPTPTGSTAPGDQQSHRLFGPDRIATAIAVGQDVFPDVAAAPAAVLTTSGTYADALAGGVLAAKVGGPLLLTTPGRLDASVKQELRRVVKAGGTIYVLGDTGAVSADVEAQLRPTFAVTRLAGATRFDTALAIADKMRALGAKGPVYLVTGTNFPDGLAVAALAAHTDGLVVLSNDKEMDEGTLDWLIRDDPRTADVVPVGGPARIAADRLPSRYSFSAIDGVDRYDTARRVAGAFGPLHPSGKRTTIGLATGSNWPDALVAGAAMGHLGGPLLLTEGAAPSLTPATDLAAADLTRDGIPSDGVIFGGSDVLSDGAMKDLSGWLPQTWA